MFAIDMFTIDEVKVKNLMDAEPVEYGVADKALEFRIPSTTVYSVDFTPATNAIDAEKYISDLRERVIASGIALKSPQELDREIGEMRRRGF